MSSPSGIVPISSAVPFCSTSRFLQLYDARQTGDLLLDNNMRLTGIPSLESNEILNNLMLEATGEVESWVYCAQKYNVSDLQSLTGASKKLLERITGAIAWWFAYDRRHQGSKPIPAMSAWAFGKLEMMLDGKNIFGLAANSIAGNPVSGIMSCQDWRRLALGTDVSRRLWGLRAKYVAAQGGIGAGGGGQCGCDGDGD